MSYINYPLGTMVKIKSTGDEGEAYESLLGFISVFINGEDKCRYFMLDDVEFLPTCSFDKTDIAEITNTLATSEGCKDYLVIHPSAPKPFGWMTNEEISENEPQERHNRLFLP